MKRMSFVLLTLLTLGSLLLAGCQPAEPTEVVATEPPATEAAVTYSTDPVLAVIGAVENELNLSEADLHAMEVITITAAAPGKDPKEYTGVRLNDVLAQAGVLEGSPRLLITASDGFSAEVLVADVTACADCLVAFDDPGIFRLAMPGLEGKAWVKNVVQIEVIGAPENSALILATTTSTQDSGLLDVLIPLFQAQTGYVVQTVAVGSGQAMTMGQEGNADVLLVHAPASEVTFMADGYGKDRFLVMHNDFILVGPEEKSGVVFGLSIEDALNTIGSSGLLFVSRGDDSGTHKAELKLWGKSGIDPKGQSWYQETGQGMGASLTIASELGAFILTDRATFLAQQDSLSLAILVEGDASLLNVYHVITVHPEKWPLVNYEGAMAFAEFMISDATQAVIGDFGVAEFGQPLFYPDADKTDAELGLP